MGERLRESAEELIGNQSMFSQMGKLFPSLLWYPLRNPIDLNMSESNPYQNFNPLNVFSTVKFRNKKWSQAILLYELTGLKRCSNKDNTSILVHDFISQTSDSSHLVWCYWGLTSHTSKILDLFARALIPISADGTSKRNITLSARKCVAYTFTDDHLRTGNCTMRHKEPGSLFFF